MNTWVIVALIAAAVVALIVVVWAVIAALAIRTVRRAHTDMNKSMMDSFNNMHR